VGADRLELHEAYCFRNNTRCGLCGKVVSKSELEAHEESTHRARPCPGCGQLLTQPQQQQHQCPCRLEECQYCELPMPLELLFDHQEACGSKTRTCEGCRRRVTFRDYFLHREECDKTPLTGTEPLHKTED
jgi:hypothetical protein